MIKIEAIGGSPKRKLTNVELQTVTSQHSDGSYFYYYQGDEPKIEPQQTIDLPNWLGLEQALFYSGLRAKAKASANLDQFEFASLIGAFGNGKIGLASEGTLIYLLKAINADWDSNDIALLNQLLEQNNFTVRYA